MLGDTHRPERRLHPSIKRRPWRGSNKQQLVSVESNERTDNHKLFSCVEVCCLLPGFRPSLCFSLSAGDRRVVALSLWMRVTYDLEWFTIVFCLSLSSYYDYYVMHANVCLVMKGPWLWVTNTASVWFFSHHGCIYCWASGSGCDSLFCWTGRQRGWFHSKLEFHSSSSWPEKLNNSSLYLAKDVCQVWKKYHIHA